jgi:hypothetical protein
MEFCPHLPARVSGRGSDRQGQNPRRRAYAAHQVRAADVLGEQVRHVLGRVRARGGAGGARLGESAAVLRPCLRSGDAAAYDYRTLHRGGANAGGAERPLLQLVYRRAGRDAASDWDEGQNFGVDALLQEAPPGGWAVRLEAGPEEEAQAAAGAAAWAAAQAKAAAAAEPSPSARPTLREMSFSPSLSLTLPGDLPLS